MANCLERYSMTGTVKKEIDEETYSSTNTGNDHPDMVLGEFVKDKLTADA